MPGRSPPRRRRPQHSSEVWRWAWIWMAELTPQCRPMPSLVYRIAYPIPPGSVHSLAISLQSSRQRVSRHPRYGNPLCGKLPCWPARRLRSSRIPPAPKASDGGPGSDLAAVAGAPGDLLVPNAGDRREAGLHDQLQSPRPPGRGIQDYWQTTVALPSRSHIGVVVGYLIDGSATVTVPVMPTRRGVLDSMATSTRFRPFSDHFFAMVPPT